MAAEEQIQAGVGYRHIQMLDSVTSDISSVWFDVRTFNQSSIGVEGKDEINFDAIVSVHTSIARIKPLPLQNGIVRDSVTAAGEITYDVLPCWMKVAVTDYESGIISVNMILRHLGVK
jgi:hypothetical protein